MSTDNVTPEQAREAAEALKLYEHGYTGSTPHYAAVLRYIDQSAARIAELQSLTAWRPIETAPRDGTRVLLYCPSSGETSRITTGRWEDGRFRKKPSPYWELDAWSFAGPTTHRQFPPTHWLPLPAAPEVSNGK